MKKWICGLLSCCLLLGVTACNRDDKPDSPDSSQDGAPSFIGMTYDDVMNTPVYADTYTIEKSEQFSDTAEKGVITDQSPRPGQSMRSNVIRIVVSKGPRYAPTTTTMALRKRIPRVVDMLQQDAITELTKKGFVVNPDHITYVNNDMYDRGTVITQEPAGGVYDMTGTEVKLTVSSGYVDADVTVTFPLFERTIDVEIYVDNKKQTERDLNIPLSNLLMMDLQSFTFTTRLQKNAYSVEIRVSESGANQFKPYAIYRVNGVTGEVKQTASYPLS